MDRRAGSSRDLHIIRGQRREISLPFQISNGSPLSSAGSLSKRSLFEGCFRVAYDFYGLVKIGCCNAGEIGCCSLAFMNCFMIKKPVYPRFPDVIFGVSQLCGNGMQE